MDRRTCAGMREMTTLRFFYANLSHEYTTFICASLHSFVVVIVCNCCWCCQQCRVNAQSTSYTPKTTNTHILFLFVLQYRIKIQTFFFFLLTTSNQFTAPKYTLIQCLRELCVSYTFFLRFTKENQAISVQLFYASYLFLLCLSLKIVVSVVGWCGVYIFLISHMFAAR